MYMEDDTAVSWEAVQSWAADTEALEPHGLIRGFYRTEVHGDSGQVRMLDTKSTRVDVLSPEAAARLVQAEVPVINRCSVADPTQRCGKLAVGRCWTRLNAVWKAWLLMKTCIMCVQHRKT